MAIELKEYCGFTPGGLFTLRESANPNVLNEGPGAAALSPDCVYADIEGIHSFPVVTRNYTRYTEECLKNSVPYWTKPYMRPLIKHHNQENGKTIGRVVAAEYRQSQKVKDAHTLVFTVMVPKEPDSSDVKTGLLQTVSIGAIGTDVRCSICGQNIARDGMCEHERGEMYDGQLCTWDIYAMEPKELSYVIVPSDPYAGNIDVYTKKDKVPSHPLHEMADDNLYGGKIKLDEKEKTELEQRIAELESKVKQAEEDKKTVEDAKAELEKQLDDEKKKSEELQGKVDAAAEELKKVQADLTAKSEELDKVKEESEVVKKEQAVADEKLVAAQESYHNLLVKSVQFARKTAGLRELDESVASKRTDASLMDTLCDLQEGFEDVRAELKEKENKKLEPNKVTDPTLPNLDEKANQNPKTPDTEEKVIETSHDKLRELFMSLT